MCSAGMSHLEWDYDCFGHHNKLLSVVQYLKQFISNGLWGSWFWSIFLNYDCGVSTVRNPVSCLQSTGILHHGCCSISNLFEVEFCRRGRCQVNLDYLDWLFFFLFSWVLIIEFNYCSEIFFQCSDCEVFPKNHAAPFSKVLTFYRREPFSLEAYYNCPKELPYPDPTIGKHIIIIFYARVSCIIELNAELCVINCQEYIALV